MEKTNIQYLIDKYISLTFSVHKQAEGLIKDQLGDDITYDQHYILRYIHQTKNCTATELADIFDVKKSAITAIINRLDDKKLIERTRDENDRRVVYLTLTQEGIDFFNKAEQKVQALVESFITKFEDNEINAFINTYEKLATILTNIKEEIQEE